MSGARWARGSRGPRAGGRPGPVEAAGGDSSQGLKQRVGLAVALLPDPEVLILDEPTSGLDPIQRREVRRLVAELSDQHTVLLSSHILAEIETMAPRA